MSLTPNDIRNYDFSNQMRGYDKEEVEDYIEQIAAALEELKQVNLKLSMESDSTKTQLNSLRQHEDSIKQAMIDARRYADDTIAKAKIDAEEIVCAAKEESFNLNKSNIELSQTFTGQIDQLKENKIKFIAQIKELVSDHLTMINLVESNQPVINFEVKEPAAQETTPEVTPSTPAYEAPVETTPEVTQPTPVYEAPVETTPEVTQPTPVYEAPVETTPEVTQPTPVYEAPVETTPEVTQPEAVVEPNGITVTESEDITRENLESLSEESSSDPLLNKNDNDNENEIGGTIINEEHEDHPATEEKPPVVVNQEVDDSSQIDPELAEALNKYQNLLNNKNESGPVPTPEPAPPIPEVQAQPETPKQGEMIETDKRADDIPEGFVVGSEVPEQASTDHVDTGKMIVPEAAENNAVQEEAPAVDPVAVAPQLTPDNIANEFDNIVAKFAEELEKAEKN